MKWGSITNVYNEELLIGGFLDLMDVDIKVVVISDISYQGKTNPTDNSEKIAQKKGAHIIKMHTTSQPEMRNKALEYLQSQGVEYAFFADVDEWYPKSSIEKIKKFVEENPADAYKIKMMSLYRRPNWYVPCPLDSGSCVVIKTSCRMNTIRYHEGNLMQLPHVPIYHFSYCRTPEKMLEKVTNFSHAHEVLDGWYENKWLACTPTTTNVHPTAPSVWSHIEVIELPEEIKSRVPQILWTS